MKVSPLRTLILTREPAVLAKLVESAFGCADPVVVGDLEELAEWESSAEDFALVLFDQEGLSRDKLPAAMTAVKRLMPNAPAVLLVEYPLTPGAQFRAMLAGIDVVDKQLALADPQRVAAQYRGTWPGTRHLRAFCERNRLSRMETWALLAACSGLAKCEACEEMGCSIRTLESHWSGIFGKTGIRCTDGVIAAALREVLGGVGRESSQSPSTARRQRGWRGS